MKALLKTVFSSVLGFVFLVCIGGLVGFFVQAESSFLEFGLEVSAPESVNISIDVEPSGAGNVIGDDPGEYEHGEQIELEAVPNEGYEFDNWTENGVEISTDENLTFEVGIEDRDLVANFILKEYDIEVESVPQDGGSVSGGGVYSHGENVSISADPNEGYEFVEWQVDGIKQFGTKSPTFQAVEDLVLEAIFEKKEYDVSLNTDGDGSAIGAGTYEHGEKVSIIANPSPGNQFVKWLDVDNNELSQDSVYSFTITGHRSITAVFEKKEYKIDLSAYPSIGGDVYGAGVYKHGDAVEIEADSNAGYIFDKWEEDGNLVYATTKVKFTAIGDRNLVAIFKDEPVEPEPEPEPTYSIVASSGENGDIEPSGVRSVEEGEDKMFNIIPDEGYGVYEVYVDGEEKGRLNEYTFENVSDDHTIHVDFEKIVNINIDIDDDVGGDFVGDDDDFLVGDDFIIDEGDIDEDDGYELEYIIIIDEDGNEIIITKDDLPYTYKITGDFELKFVFSKLPEEPEEVVDESLVSRIGQSISGAAGAFASGIRDLDVDDEITQTTSTAVGAVVVPLTALSLLSSQFGMYYYLMQLFLGILGIMGLRKKGKPYGVIYNSVTKEPINRAIVRVYDTAGKLVHTDVSDVYGVFSGELQDGNYTMEVFARGYEFPSGVVSGSADKPYTNIYRGGEFTLDANNPLQYSIPLDPLEVDRIKYAQALLINRITKYLGVLQKILVFVGLLLSIFVYIRVPSTFNLVIMCIYIPLFILSFLNIFMRERGYGKVETEDLDKSEVTLGLRELEFETLVGKRICDKHGRYRFLVPGGKYRLEVMNEGYELSKDYTFEGPKDKPLLINDNIKIVKTASWAES